MKKLMIITFIAVELFVATVRLADDNKCVEMHAHEELKRTVIENFEVVEEPSVEIVDEYTLAMGGFLA